MIVGNLLDQHTSYIADKITHKYNIISYFNYDNLSATQLSSTMHNVLIFPIINSYDEAKFSAFGWECAIRSAFDGCYTVTSIFIVSPTMPLIDNCITTINSFDDSCIIDNVWLWPDTSITPTRNTKVSKLPFQTKLSESLLL